MAFNHRTFSFDDDGNDNEHFPSSQQHRSSTFQVSNPAAFLPDLSRQRSPSPVSSVGSAQSVGQRQRDTRYESAGNNIPMQETSRRMSAYGSQRQGNTSYHNGSPTRSRDMDSTAQAQVPLHNQDYDIPTPPPHMRPVLSSDESPYSPYHDRTAPRPPTHMSHHRDNSTSEDGSDPFATPTRSRVSLAPPVAVAGLGAAGLGRPNPDRFNSGYSGLSGYADSASTNFRNSRIEQDGLGGIDPIDIEDEDDDPFSSITKKHGKNGSRGALAGAGAGVGAAAGAVASSGGFFKGLGSRDTSGQYGSVPGGLGGKGEGSAWLNKQRSGNKRLKWTVGGLIVLVIVLAIVGGVVGVLLSNKKSPSTGSSGDPNANLTKDSPEIQKLLNNKNLHKVFPGMDYTPQNAQYPDCLTNPPSQAFVTQDVAVLSQLTPLIRLYGTDCNQTEMVLEALDTLDLKDSIKLWAGVWIDSNVTTSTRQLEQFYDIMDKYGADPFLGVVVGNEILFRKDMTETELVAELNGVRTNLTAKGMSGMKIATSDLGSSWTANLAEAVDVVMSNIHPFFGGVQASNAASWTYNYWQTTDVALTQGTSKGQVIAETGWPSAGGNDCTNGQGSSVDCPNDAAGAIAGIDGMNLMMSEWVCEALTNGTEYFWFEAFDEPWKVIYNTPGKEWEDKWGLMDVNRNLKPGVTIPDCAGAEAKLPS